ncbi:conjugative transposon protein TraN, partial [uncultured Duncaniella sp.]|uniref:conjugative transposon protein TraN n=1 Tax=uncultured Duncaniella sp. TaxID=2768039 RepID=UPI0025B69282
MRIKTIILSAIAVLGMATPVFAKSKTTVNNTDNNVSPDTEKVAEHDLSVYGSSYTDGDKFDGLTRKVGFDRMIPPHALEVCYHKTTHIIFPAEIIYVDLGNENLVAGLADGAKNVLRVKSAFKRFKTETNLSVITDDGSYYVFNVKFAKEPLLLSIEMTDFLHDGEAVNESPMLVKLIMKSIYKQNKREIKHIGSKRFGVQFLLKSIYTNNGLLYFHTELKNTSNIPFDVDFVSFKIVDKKVIKRTAMQEQVIE